MTAACSRMVRRARHVRNSRAPRIWPLTAATKSQGMNQYEYPALVRSRKMAGMGTWMARNQRQPRRCTVEREAPNGRLAPNAARTSSYAVWLGMGLGCYR